MALTGSAGQLLVNNVLPKDMRDYERQFDKKVSGSLMQELLEKHPDDYAAVLQKLNNVSALVADRTGVSVSLKHLITPKAVQAEMDRFKAQNLADLQNPALTDEQRDKRRVVRGSKVFEKVKELTLAEGLKAGSPFAHQAASGSRGNPGQLSALMGAADIITANQEGNPNKTVIYGNYGKGLTPAEYIATTYGTRKNLVDVKFATGDAGFLAKQLVLAAHRLNVTDDKPDKQRNVVGLPVEVADPDNEGAVLAQDAGKYKAGTTLTPRILADLKGVRDRILVHSPITSIAQGGGIDRLSAGVRERGRLAEIGDLTGISSSQAISEPVSQGLLDCLVEGTKVLMSDFSKKPVEEIEPGEFIMGANQSGEMFPVRVNHKFDNGLQPCVETSFTYGQTKVAKLRSTVEHKCLVSTVFTNHSEDKYNNQLRKLPIGKKCRDLRIARPQGYISTTGKSEPMAYLLGALLGDGCYTKSVHGVHLSCADPVMLSYLDEYLPQFDLQCKHRSAYYFGISKLSKRTNKKNNARRMLDKYSCGHKYAHQKTIPEQVKYWDNTSVSELIAGLIDTDGTVFLRKDRGSSTLGFGFCSTSKRMVKQVVELLQFRFGIYPGKIKVLLPGQHESRHANYPLYSFHCTERTSVLRFAHAIPLHGVKSQKVKSWVSMAPSTVRRMKNPGSAKRISQEDIGVHQCWDLEVDHPDHLFVLANGLIVSNSKHGSAVAGPVGRAGFTYLNNLFQAPEAFDAAGPLAPVSGRVQAVRAAPQGGHYVEFPGGEEIYLKPELTPQVKPGDKLDRGDDLSDGIPHPRDLVKYRGIGEARRVYTEILREGLENSGIGANRRNIETLAAGVINHVQIRDPDDRFGYSIDQVVPYSEIARQWKARPGHEVTSIKKSVGRYLEEPVLHYTPGTYITPKVAKDLEEFDVQDIQTHRDAPNFEARHERLLTNATHDQDWQTRLGAFYTGRALTEAVHQGLTSDTQSTSFFPSIAQGIAPSSDRPKIGPQ